MNLYNPYVFNQLIKNVALVREDLRGSLCLSEEVRLDCQITQQELIDPLKTLLCVERLELRLNS